MSSSAKPLVVVTRPIPDIGIKKIKAHARVKVNPRDRVYTPKELLAFVRGADGIVSLLTDKITADVLRAAGPQLKVVANYAVGYDNIDIAAARAKQIAVTNTPGVLTEAVAEHTIALMLSVARRVVEADTFTRNGKYQGWEPDLLIGQRMLGRTIGVVGLGRIGKFVAHMAHFGFGMRVLYSDPHREPEFEAEVQARHTSLGDLLEHSDVVSIHVPFLPSTHHLIDKKAFGKMKKNAILINTARGPIVDEAALVLALKKKQIWGAGIDVFEHEPALTPGLTDLPNVILTPHIASGTREARDEMSLVVATNVIAALHRRIPPNIVTK